MAPAPSSGSVPASPIRRCLRLLDRLAATGAAFIQRLRACRERTTRPRARRRANALTFRAHVSLAHLHCLVARLTADSGYRGEPPRPSRPCSTIVASRPQRRPSTRRAKPRPYEQVFAGRSVGQIVDRIRRDLGHSGRIASQIDECLARAARKAAAR